MDVLNALAKQLEPLFQGLPSLPKGAKDWLVSTWPVLAIIFGLLQLYAAWALWHLGHLVNTLVNYSNDLANIYRVNPPVSHLGLFYWVGLVFLVVDAVILFLAYSGLKARSRDGWNLLFLSAIVNAVYGLFLALDSYYGGVGRLVSSLIGSAIGLYVLYQVLPYYSGKHDTKKAS